MVKPMTFLMNDVAQGVLLRLSLMRFLLLMLLIIGELGCSNVMPWERKNLAKPQMAPQPFGAQAQFREHIYGAREAATGSTLSNGGGGCGCY